MGVDLVGWHSLCGEEALQSDVLGSDHAGNSLHLQGGLTVAALILADAALQILEEFSVAGARATLVLAVEGQGLWRSVLFDGSGG
jgi:hypothetical protein